jgi:hypothetical protein
MAVSGVSAGANAASQQSLSLSPHKHSRHHVQSAGDTGSQGSSATGMQSAAGSTNAPGHKVNILA